MSVCPTESRTASRQPPGTPRVRRCTTCSPDYHFRRGFPRSARKIAHDPLGFAAQTWRAFRANQGLLLAGGVAYYTLLSIVPLMILLVIILSHVIEADRLMATLARYLEIVVPGQSRAADRGAARLHRAPRSDRLDARRHADVLQLARVLRARECDVGDLLPSRARRSGGRCMVSVLIPYLYILFLGIGLLRRHARRRRAAVDRDDDARFPRPRLVAVGRRHACCST